MQTVKPKIKTRGIKFEPRDLWIGLFWDHCGMCSIGGSYHWITIYVCLIPCFPIWFEINHKFEPFEDE